MIQLLRTPALLLALSTLLVAGSRTETRTEAFKSGGTLVVRTQNSPLSVQGWDREEVSLVAEIKDSPKYPIQLEVRKAEGRLEIEAVFPNRSGWSFGFSEGNACAMTLKVPRRLEGQFRTSNARLDAKGLEGRLEFRTSNAQMTLEELGGSVEAKTSNATVRAKNITAALQGSTSNGSLRFEHVEGPLAFSTSNAGILATGLDGQGKGIRLETSNGKIEVELGKATGSIRAKTSRHEKVKVERPGIELVDMSSHADLRLKAPGRDQEILLRTSNGGISIR